MSSTLLSLVLVAGLATPSPRPRAEISAEIRLLEAEDAALPGPDRALELALGFAGLLLGVPMLVGDFVYYASNTPFSCGSFGSLGGLGTCPPSTVDDGIALPLLVAGSVLAAAGLVSLIIGLARRPDAATQARRNEIRQRIREDVIELRMQPSASGAVVTVAGRFE